MAHFVLCACWQLPCSKMHDGPAYVHTQACQLIGMPQPLLHSQICQICSCGACSQLDQPSPMHSRSARTPDARQSLQAHRPRRVLLHTSLLVMQALAIYDSGMHYAHFTCR